MVKRSHLIGLAAACLALNGCGGGSSSTVSSGTGGGGGDPVGTPADVTTATFKVDVASGNVTVIKSGDTPTAAGTASPKAVFTGNTVGFASSQLLNVGGTTTGQRVLNVSLTNQFGLTIGADSNSNINGLRVTFSPISNLSSALDPRPLVTVSSLAGAGTTGNLNGPYASAQFTFVQGVVVDASGALYATDEYGLSIRKLSNGQVSLLAGGAGSVTDGTGASAGFGGPHGIVYSPTDGALYVADSGANRIRRVTLTGQVSTIAGSGTAAETDGVGSAAAFNKPDGIAVDSIGNIYVTDNVGNKV